MTLTIDSAEADRLAHDLASATGESLDEAVTQALRERLDRCRPVVTPAVVSEAERERRRAVLRRVKAAFAGREVLDPRSDNEILGYNEHGTFD